MSFTKVAPAGIGTEPGTSIRIGDSLLHSTGIDIGSNTGIGVTIRKHGDATFTGIITASAFFGDGSGLEGVSSSGIGTPLSDDDTSDLNKIYYVNQELSIGSTVTVNHPDSAVASYTHYQDLVVTDDADFIVADGDTFIPDVLGIRTSTSTASAATGGRIRAGTITNAGANGAVNFPNGLTGTAGTFTGAITAASGTITGNLGVGGVLTYEDVTNVDSVGVITARSGIDAASNLLLKTGGTERLRINSNGFVGINTSSPLAPLHTYEATNNTIARLESGDATCRLQLKDNTGEAFVAATGDNLIFANTSSITERLRINSTGQVLVNTTTATNADNRIESHSAGGYNIVAKSTNGNGGYQNFTGLASNGTVTSYITHNGRGYFEDGVQFDSSGEVLDAYEEGTFTPTILNGWGILNSNPQIATGKYVRIGAIVYIYFSFKEGSGTGASFNSNRLALYNFPYNPDGTFGTSGGNNFSHPLVAYTNSNSSGGENVIGVPGNNGATVFSFITKQSNGYGSFTGSNLGTGGQIFCAGTYRITGT